MQEPIVTLDKCFVILDEPNFTSMYNTPFYFRASKKLQIEESHANIIEIQIVIRIPNGQSSFYLVLKFLPNSQRHQGDLVPSG